MPRDSLTAQMICCDSTPKVDTAVRGRAVPGLPWLRVRGRDVVVVYLYEGYDEYDVLALLELEMEM